MSMIQQWSMRERVIVLGGVIVLLILAIHALLWQPLMDDREQLIQQVEQAEQDTDWIAQNVVRLSVTQTPQTKKIQGSLVSWLDLQTQQQQLKSYLKRIKPSGSKQVKLDFKQAPSQKIIQFIARVEQQGLKIERVKISSNDEPNLIDAQLTVTR